MTTTVFIAEFARWTLPNDIATLSKIVVKNTKPVDTTYFDETYMRPETRCDLGYEALF